MNNKRIFITERQLATLKESYTIDPKKVLLVKKYLDSHFTKGKMGFINGTGTWEDKPIVSMTDSSGNPVRNMTDRQLYDLLVSKFNEEKHLYGDKEKTNKLLQVIMKAWYEDNITKEGLIKHINVI
jgi:hypothetical protein